MSEIEIYARENLASEILVIEGTNRKKECPQLNTYHKAVIYKYSNDGFKDINEELRKSKGKAFSDFAKHLNIALNQLPNYDGLVYRKVHLTKQELTKYRNAFKNDKLLKEFTFTSTTKSRLIAMNFAGTTAFIPNCLDFIDVSSGFCFLFDDICHGGGVFLVLLSLARESVIIKICIIKSYLVIN